jgi:acetyl-CoA C-acetyltransferase
MREPRGSIPINPSGGLTGPGRPVDAICVRMLHDASRQGTGHAGEIKVGGARVVGPFDVGGSETTHCLYVVGAGT